MTEAKPDHPRVGVVNCVSEAYEMLRFSSDQIIENAGTDNFDYIVVCWNVTDEVNSYVDSLEDKFKETHPRLKVIKVVHETDESIGFVPNLRKMMNEGFSKAFELNDYGGLTNTDQAFHKNWLLNLVKHIAPDRMITSTLIEVCPQTRHYKGDFGLTEYGKFNQEAFTNYANTIEKPDTLISEEQRHGLFNSPGYMNIESLPYLFPKAMWESSGPWELTLENGTPDVNFFDRGHLAGFKYFMSADSIAYHIGAVERTSKQPDFSKEMKYE